VRVSHVKVKAVVQPQLDARRFAALLLDICRQDEAKRHRDERVA
jgi:hypothetical protein